MNNLIQLLVDDPFTGQITESYAKRCIEIISEYQVDKYRDALEEKEVERLKGIINQFVGLRKFFIKGSPLTNMMDQIISDNKL